MVMKARELIRTGLPILLVLLILVIGVAPAGPALAQQPRKGGTFIMASEGEPTGLNPYIQAEQTALIAAVPIANFLVTLDQKLRPQPDLAESWSIGDEGRTYTFKLVRNATWHDGKPFTSADVKYNLQELLPKHPKASTWWTPTVQSVEAPDDSTVIVRLKKPFAPFLTLFGMPSTGPQMLPKHVYEGTDLKTNPANNQPIGTGPFKFKEWVKGQRIELVRNDTYFKKGLPYLDRLVITFLPDAAGRMLAFEKGEVDFIHWYAILHQRVPEYKKNSNITVDERGGEGFSPLDFVLFNLRHPILGKREVRQAIATALNKEEIAAKAVYGLGKVAHSVVHPSIAWAYNPEVPKYPYNVEKAGQMLDQAGYPKGADGNRFQLSLTWQFGRDMDGLAAEVIRDQLRAVGIQVEIKKFDRATFIDQVYMNWNFDVAVLLLATGVDPAVSVTRFLHSREIKKASFANGMGYSNPEVDKLLDLEITQTDPKERGQTWGRVQTIVATDLPVLPLFQMPVANTYYSKFKNVTVSAFGQLETREQVWIDEGSPTTTAQSQVDPTLVAAGLAVAVVVLLGGIGFAALRRRAR